MNRKLVSWLCILSFLILWSLPAGVYAASPEPEKTMQDPGYNGEWITDGLAGVRAGSADEALALLRGGSEKGLRSFGASKPAPTYTLKDTVQSSFDHSRAYKFQQTYNGVPVFGMVRIVNTDKDGYVQAISGDCAPDIVGMSLDTRPGMNAAQAEAIAILDRGLTQSYFNTIECELFYYMMAVEGEPLYHLAYRVVLCGRDETQGFFSWVIMVDATDGKILDREDRMDHLTGTGEYIWGNPREFTCVYENGEYIVNDPVRNFQTFDMYETTSSLYLITSDTTDFGYTPGADAAYFAEKTYDFYNNNFGWRGMTGAGNHFDVLVGYGNPGTNAADNAFQSGSDLVFGSGNWDYDRGPYGAMVDLCTAHDVVAHEFTHGVTEHSAGLVYKSISGALNEAFSDILGTLAEGKSSGSEGFYLIGEDVMMYYHVGLRSLKNPEDYGLPSTMNGYVHTTSDEGGVHTNMGIPSKAFYIMSRKISQDKLAQIWFGALTQYLTPYSDFWDARNATAEEARTMYGSSTAKIVAAAWDSVGVYAESPDLPGDSLAMAVALSPNTTRFESINWSGDRDFYKLTPANSAEYVFSTEGTTDTYGFLYNAGGRELRSNNDSGAGSNFRIQYSLEGGETYYLLVRHNKETGYGDYTLNCTADIPALSDLAVTPSAASPQEINTKITFTARTGYPGAAEYRVEIRESGSASWLTVQPYRQNNAYDWTPAKIGVYDIRVSARAADRTNDADRVWTATYQITEITPQAGVSLSSSMNPAEKDAPVTFTATPQGPQSLTSRARYQFRLKQGRKWTTVQTWSDDNTYEWTPPKTGTYALEVQSRTDGRTTVDRTDMIENFRVEYPPELDAVTLEAAPGAPRERNTAIELSATASGDQSYRAEYLFRVKNGRRWSTLRGWGPVSTYTWTPTKTGKYTVEVQARTHGRPSVDKTAAMDYTVVDIYPLDEVCLSSSEPGMQPAGTEIVLSAAARGPHADEAEYLFQYSTDGRKWRSIGNGKWTDSHEAPYAPDKDTVYQFRVQARSHGRSGVDVTDTISQRFYIGPMPVEDVSFTVVNPVDIQETGKTVRLTAGALGEAADDAEYLYRVKLGRKWITLRNWDSDPDYDWQPEREGTYTIEVQARTQGRTGIDDTAAAPYRVVNVFPLTGVTLSGTPSGILEAGTEITLRAAAEGPYADSAEYAFQYSLNGRKWYSIRKAFEPDSVITYTPAKEAVYLFRVQARSAGRSGVDAEDTVSQRFYVGTMPVESVSLETEPPGTQEVQRTVTLRATAHGDTAANAEYLFRVKLGRKWTTIRDWGVSSTYEWTPDKTGTYTVEVQTRNRGRKGTDAVDTVESYAVVLPPPLGGVTLQADRLTPQEINTGIILTAKAQGDESETDRAQYLFRLRLGRRWSTLQNWSANGICLWTPDKTGTYTIEVQARTKGRPGTDHSTVIEDYEIQLPPALTEVELTASEDSPQEVKTSIELNAVGKIDGAQSDRAEYLFRAKLGRKWITLQNWSEEAGCTWEPTKTGTYTIEVQARTAGRSSVDASQTMTYTMTDIVPVSSVTIDANPEYGVTDESTTITAEADRPEAEYRFLCRQADAPYELLQEWSGDTDCEWTPGAEGEYTLLVLSRARQQDSVQAVRTLAYQVLAVPPVRDITIGANPQDGQELGGTVEIIAQADQPDAEYQFAYSVNGGEFIEVQGFSSDASFTWEPDGTGVYEWRVRARTDDSFPQGQTESRITYRVYTEVTILDAALRDGLKNILGKTPDDILTNLDMASLSDLDCSGWGIEELTGIESAVNIVSLDLSDNHIHDLAPLQTLIDNGGLAGTGSKLDISLNGLDGRDGTPVKSLIDEWTDAGIETAYLPQHPVVGSVVLTADKESPEDAGTVIHLKAQSDQAGVEYRFSVNDTVLAEWTDEDTVAWTPDTPGIYTLTVQARTWGMPENEVTDSIQYEVLPAPLSDVSLGAVPEASIEQGNTVTLSAASQAGAWYQFQVMGESGEWSAIGDWSQSGTAEWVPESAGEFTLRVQAHRDGRPSDSVDASDTMAYTVIPLPVTGDLGITVSPESPLEAGTEITVSVSELGPAAEYWFGVQTTEEDWVWTGEWGADTSVSWTPVTSGIYILTARARAQGRSGYDLEDTLVYTVTPPPIGAVSLSIEPESPHAVGTQITLTAESEGSDPEYCFSVKAEEGDYEVIGGWSDSKTATWTPDAPGTYILRVQARESGQSAATAEASTLSLAAWPSLESLDLEIDKTVTYQYETRRLTAIANTEYAEFKFTVQNPDGTWNTLQDWSEVSVCDWTTSTPGDYVLQVEGRGLGRVGSDRSDTLTMSVYPSPPMREWSAYFGGNGDEDAKAVRQASDAGFILAGQTRSADMPNYSGGSDAYLVKTDSMGNLQWQYCRGGDLSDMFRDVVQTADGGFLAVGQKQIGSDVYVFIVKVTAQGFLDWERSYGGSGSSEAYSIVKTSDGNYCIAGYVCDGGLSQLSAMPAKRIATGVDGFVLKITETGQPLWLKYFGGNDLDHLYDIKESSDGSLICVGETRSTDLDNHHGGTDGWVIRTNPSGILQWQKPIGGSGQDCFYNACIRQVEGQERYEMVGVTKSSDGDTSGYHGLSDGYFVSINSSGNICCAKCLGGSGNEQLKDITITEDQGLILIGYSTSIDGSLSDTYGNGFGWMVRINTNNQVLWQKRIYDMFGGEGYIDKTFDGRYILAGSCQNLNSAYGSLMGSNFLLTKLTSEGAMMPFFAELSFEPQIPQSVGVPVTITGRSNLDGIEYRFLCYDEAGTETVLRDWGADVSVEWTPNASGIYVVKMQARIPQYAEYIETDALKFSIQ